MKFVLILLIKNKQILKGLFFLVILSSCTHDKKPNFDVNLISITPDLTFIEELNLNQEFDLISIIELETNQNSLIGDIKKIEFNDKHQIFISETRDPSRVLIFDKNGDFKKEFKKYGFGPSEYQNIDDFIISDDSTLSILDGKNKSILNFNLNTEKLINAYQLPFSANKFDQIDSTNYIFYKNEQLSNFESENFHFDLILTNSEFEIIDTAIPFFLVENRGHFSISKNQVFSKFNNEFYFSNLNSDTLYHIYKEEINKRYFIDYGKDKLSLEGKTFSTAIEKMNYFYKNSNSKIPFIFNVFYRNNKMYFSYPFRNKQVYFSIYDMESNTTKTFNKIVSDSLQIPIFPPPKFHSNDKFFSIIDFQYSNAILNENMNLTKDFRNKLISIEKGESNQILIIY